MSRSRWDKSKWNKFSWNLYDYWIDIQHGTIWPIYSKNSAGALPPIIRQTVDLWLSHGHSEHIAFSNFLNKLGIKDGTSKADRQARNRNGHKV